MQNNILWKPDVAKVKASPMSRFAEKCEDKAGEEFQDYAAFHDWSVQSMADFWNLAWDHFAVIGDKGKRVIESHEKIFKTKFFPEAKLNFSENLLRKNTDEPAIIFRREDGLREIVSWKELNSLVSRLQQAMVSHGVGEGDRVAAMVPNAPYTVAAMLATVSIGAVWSSCSPDFGEQAVVDRFGQIEPKLFLTCDGYFYNGKKIDLTEKIGKISQRIDTVTVVFPFVSKAEKVTSNMARGITFDEFICEFSEQKVVYKRLPFSHPLYILFSSGTTGKPKCIVHCAGGVLLQHLKEHKLHCGIGENSRVLYFTTCGWMMWNWLVSVLSSGATMILYDGSPAYPKSDVLFDYIEQDRITVFGTSAKYIDSLRNQSLVPLKTHDLSSLELILSTGSPLSPDNFSYVYSDIKQDVHLASISGGTDIVACFVGAVPWQKVHSGQIQGKILAMDVNVWNDDGKPIVAEKGELVCSSPFPSMPIGSWNDHDNEKYHNAYFERFENVWCQGDFSEQTPEGGFIIHGRSDATLNPGGVRIGTAEIYNQVESLDDIQECLCVGQEWQGDTRIILFVRLSQGIKLDDEFKNIIRRVIREGASPRHVPAVIIAVTDLPRTKSGKIAELAIREVIHGRDVKNDVALANPESLELYRSLPELFSET